MSGFMLVIFLIVPIINLHAESFRTVIENTITITTAHGQQNTTPIPIALNGAVLIKLGEETRFFRGIELDISAPQAWLLYRNSVAMAVYNNLTGERALNTNFQGTIDLDGRRVIFEPLPGKLQNTYQIPMRRGHGLRTTTFVSVSSVIIEVNTFPILFTLLPLVKGMTNELETMKFNLTVRPILSDEGAVRLIPRYPPQLRGKPFTVLVNDELINNISQELILKEGEHHLVILSEDYRNESRRFVVERAKIHELIIDLQDPAPLIIFEGPQNARIYLNNVLIQQDNEPSHELIDKPITVEPGQHEVKFQIGDYTIMRSLNVQRGKTYRISLAVDLSIHEYE
jgi:hypothetical protein